MAIEQVAKKYVVDGSHVRHLRRSEQDGKRKPMLPHQSRDAFRICGVVQIHRKQLQTLRRPDRVARIENHPVFLASFRSSGPKVEQHRLSAQGRKGSRLPAKIVKSEE